MTSTKPRKMTVVLPDGEIATRKTRNDYTHVLAVRADTSDGWAALSWHGSFDLAQKKQRSAAKWVTGNPEFKIVRALTPEAADVLRLLRRR